jgi:hypothetical protein
VKKIKNENKKIKFYCKDDNKTCCSLCNSIGEHKNHNCILISYLIEEKNKILNKKIENLKENNENDIILKIEEKIKLIKIKNLEIEKEINNSFEKVYFELNERKKYLIERNNLIKNYKIKILKNQKNIFKLNLENKKKIEEKISNSILFYNSNFNNFENFIFEIEKKLNLIFENLKI